MTGASIGDGNASGIKKYFGLLPFYIAAIMLIGTFGWLLTTSYQEPQLDTIVPLDTPPEKVMEYLKSISDIDRTKLIVREEKHLLDEPLDQMSLLNLGLLYGLQGDTEKSNRLALRAADRSYRNFSAQTAAINLSMSKKDFPDATRRIDGLLRSGPEFSKNYFPMLLNISSLPEGLSATVNMLASDPPWRKQFIDYATNIPEQQSIVYSVLAGLRDAKAEVLPSELRAYLSKLFERKDYESAYFVWLDFLSASELRKTGLIYDGGFDLPPHNLFYGWNIYPIANADVSIAAQSGTANDLALKIDFQSSHFAGVAIYQFLRLDAGSYHLSLDASADHVKADGGVLWEIRCAESGVFIGLGEPINSSRPKAAYEFDFKVTDQQCQTQELVFVTASRSALDQVVSGKMIFDNFKITKIE